jgi:2-oxoglutarate decarboxylase
MTTSTTRSSDALRIPYEPVRWAPTCRRATTTDIVKTRPGPGDLIHAYRVRGHLMADTDPLEYRQRSHPDLDV